MPNRPTHRPPQQARSRETLRRLLDAAEIVLERHGFEGATLARVAREARLSPASVYRRFRNKEALIAAVFERFGQINREELEREVDAKQIRSIGIRAFTRNVVSSMITGFRARPTLVRASMLYAQSHPNLTFVKRKAEIESKLFDKMVGIFLLWRDEIKHPDPEQAVRFAMVKNALVLIELIIFDRQPTFEKIALVSDEHLRQELPRAFLRYLGIQDE